MSPGISRLCHINNDNQPSQQHFIAQEEESCEVNLQQNVALKITVIENHIATKPIAKILHL